MHICSHSWLTLKATIEEIFELGRDALGILWGLVSSGDSIENLEDLITLIIPGRLFCYHFVYGAAQTPNVGKAIVTSLLDHLGRHPKRSAAKTLCLVFVCFDNFFRAAKVS